MEYKRPERVADQIKIEVSDILARKAADPRVAGISIVHVDLSPDLRQARIFVGVHRDSDEKGALIGLKNASGFIRSELARRMTLRRVPILTFAMDRETEQVSHLLGLLDIVGKETAAQNVEEGNS
jgi:ribosome-binding factor A